MNSVIKRKARLWNAMAAYVMVFALYSCSSVAPELVKQEEGYLYGYGKGGSLEAAELEAKRDLICNALEASMRKRSGEIRRVYVSQDAVRGISLETKRVAEQEENDSIRVTLRVREEQWDTYETDREAALRKELAPALARLTDSRPLAERVKEAVEILSRLETAGVDGLLTIEEGGTSLLSEEMVNALTDRSEKISIALSPEKGLLSGDSFVTVHLTDSAGGALSGVPLAVRWSSNGIPVGDVPQLVRTDTNGAALVRVPEVETTVSRSVSVHVSTFFAADANPEARQTAARISAIEERMFVEGVYVIGESLAKSFGPFIRVEAGPFTMGAVAGDKRASRREVSRTVETDSYEIATYPVTNAQYRLFLDATGYEVTPDFLDNPDYTVPEQPVVGVRRVDAEAFAAWLSGVLEAKVRLPTEAEWEKAAKAGQDVNFPWGLQASVEASQANFRGNGRFNRPSPVGSFPEGANPWGIHDMAGNVWEIVSSLPEEPHVVKGGSWMEGPNDLRISNRREINPEKTYADVGFRVVMEVEK